MKLQHKIIRRTDWCPDHTSGWGNGYVGVPKEHPLYGVGYTDISRDKLDVHGGLTYSGKVDNYTRFKDKSLWIFGFDTAHGDDTLENWPRKRVLEETLRLKEQLENWTQTLTIIRGLPGSGKSTKAEQLEDFTNTCWFEADMFFTKPTGIYLWSAKHIHKAHEWCYLNTYQKLFTGLDVVVSNTFTTNKEMRKYLALTEDFPNLEIKIIEMKNNYGSIHNVPEETLNKMRLRWEDLPAHQKHLVERSRTE